MSEFGETYRDDQLPWLQAVEDEDEPVGLSTRKMFVALLFVLAAIAIVAATFFWLGRRESAVNGPPELIEAPAAPYKVKPDDPGGLDVAGESQTAFETSAGQDPDAQLDLRQMPGAAVPPAPAEATPTPAAPKLEPAPPVEAPKATGGAGSTVQLGAFKNRQQAERAWTALSARFPSVAGMTKMIVPFPGGIRLRAAAASPAAAKEVCRTLGAAGENCFVAQ